MGGVCLVDLWHGSLSEFVHSAQSGSLSGDMAGQYLNLHRYQATMPEVRSWENSLAALAGAVRPLGRLDAGVAISATGTVDAAMAVSEGANSPAGVVVEYHLPYSGKRIDVMVTGHDASKQPAAVVIELKQWSRVELEDEHATNVLMQGKEHPHPCQQASDYADYLADYHSAFTEGDLVATPAAYCHEMAPPDDAVLRDPRFETRLRRSPLFIQGEEPRLIDFLHSQVGAGDGVRLLTRLAGARFRPSKRVLDTLEAVLESRDEWHLLDEQRVAYNAILDEVRRQQARSGRAAIIVRGAPGTGKTVVAVQLLAASLRLGWKAAHSTGGVSPGAVSASVNAASARSLRMAL